MLYFVQRKIICFVRFSGHHVKVESHSHKKDVLDEINNIKIKIKNTHKLSHTTNRHLKKKHENLKIHLGLIHHIELLQEENDKLKNEIMTLKQSNCSNDCGSNKNTWVDFLDESNINTFIPETDRSTDDILNDLIQLETDIDNDLNKYKCSV